MFNVKASVIYYNPGTIIKEDEIMMRRKVVNYFIFISELFRGLNEKRETVSFEKSTGFGQTESE